jgi:hypothetical protein
MGAVSVDQEAQGHEGQTDHRLQHNVRLLPRVTSVEGRSQASKFRIVSVQHVILSTFK